MTGLSAEAMATEDKVITAVAARAAIFRLNNRMVFAPILFVAFCISRE
jgi:hypothetical protein